MLKPLKAHDDFLTLKEQETPILCSSFNKIFKNKASFPTHLMKVVKFNRIIRIMVQFQLVYNGKILNKA